MTHRRQHEQVSTTTQVSTTSQAGHDHCERRPCHRHKALWLRSRLPSAPQQVRSPTIADANGVPASFAEAIAWQESGWNNDEVSGAGAVGIMQIVPATWTWIDRYLTPSAPLGTASAAENIRAGVLLLHELLR